MEWHAFLCRVALQNLLNPFVYGCSGRIVTWVTAVLLAVTGTIPFRMIDIPLGKEAII
jgi:hypothetical protein